MKSGVLKKDLRKALLDAFRKASDMCIVVDRTRRSG